MKVKITDWTEDKYYWYKSRIGEVFEVKEDSNNSNYYCTSTGARIAKSDTIPVNEIKYELESNVRCDTCVTSCEYKKNTMVGSVGCSKCEYNCGDDKTSQTVQCSWQMDLKSIAVKFHGSNQREVIRSVFKEKGFKVPDIISVGGFIGYADSCDYVCVLTECGLQDKTIVSYEEFIGGKEMKRLDVSLKIQPDGKTIVAECTHIADELRGMGVLASKDGYKLRSDYGLGLSVDSMLLYVRGEDKSRDFLVSSSIFNTPHQAQEYIRIMNELIDEINNPKTNWSKAEEGAEVTWIEELVYNSLAEVKIKANFHSYIPKMNKVVVIIGDEVKVVDEDKVELV